VYAEEHAEQSALFQEPIEKDATRIARESKRTAFQGLLYLVRLAAPFEPQRTLGNGTANSGFWISLLLIGRASGAPEQIGQYVMCSTPL